MTDLKATLDDALRHATAQQRRYRIHDPRERLVLDAATAFRTMLDDPRLAPQLEALLRDVQGGTAVPNAQI